MKNKLFTGQLSNIILLVVSACLKATFPDMAQVIDYSINEWRGFVDTDIAEGQESALISAYDEYQQWSRKDTEWVSANRKRPDGVITLNPQRHNKTTAADAINIQQDFQVAQQQFQVMQESMKLIQDGMGVYSAFLGQDSSAASGVAISNLVEQGATTLAEINDNYQFACQQVGQLLLSYLLEDLTRRRNYSVVVNRDDPRRRKSVTINEESGNGMTNDVSRLRAHIALAPIQQTPAYKSQLAERMSQVITGLRRQLSVSKL